jgi:UDP-GlcNAc3NAcA epimerase
LVYGDTNSTLAGALVASQMNIPLIHIEAGLRSQNWKMPEERNRVLTDHMSDLLFCPTQKAVDHLKNEGISQGVFFSGDVMLDMAKQVEIKTENILKITNGEPYVFMTIHRAENCANSKVFHEMIDWIKEVAQNRLIIWPIHPRSKQAITQYQTDMTGIKLIEPLGYFDMISFLSEADLVCTDSGGVQKEAFFVNTPCITMRSETEWEETLVGGMNRLWQSNPPLLNVQSTSHPFGNGKASHEIIKEILRYFV